jgi:hypothetical protein
VKDLLGAIIAAEWIVGKQVPYNERRFRIKINQTFGKQLLNFPLYTTKKLSYVYLSMVLCFSYLYK